MTDLFNVRLYIYDFLFPCSSLSFSNFFIQFTTFGCCNPRFFLVQIHLSAEAAVKKREEEAKFCSDIAENIIDTDKFMVIIGYLIKKKFNKKTQLIYS